jgi:hypothetical protein
MAINPKQILDRVVGLATGTIRRLRGGDRGTTSEAPTTVGAAKPGKPGGPKSGTASTPRKRTTGRRTTASQAAASSGDEVADAARGKDD